MIGKGSAEKRGLLFLRQGRILVFSYQNDWYIESSIIQSWTAKSLLSIFLSFWTPAGLEIDRRCLFGLNYYNSFRYSRLPSTTA